MASIWLDISPKCNNTCQVVAQSLVDSDPWPFCASIPRGYHGPRLGPAADGDYDHLGVTSTSQDPAPSPDSGYLTLCSACSGYADFRQPLHAEQRINIHHAATDCTESIHQRRRWQGHDACCAVAYRQQKSYSFQPPFASKRPFHHLDQKLEHLQHW